MHANRSRSTTTLTGIVLAAALALTACGDSQEEALNDAEQSVEAADLRSEAVTQMEPGGAEILNRVPDLEFTDITQDDSTVVSSFDKELRVEKVVQTTTIPAEVAEEMTGSSGDFEPGDLVAAADGEVFLVAVLQADDPRWEPTDQQLTGSSETETILRVGGNPLTDPYLSMEAGDQATVAVAVPEDPAQDEVTVELLQDDVSQEISLIDGTRIASDVEYIYDRPTTVEISEDASWSEEGETRRGTIAMSGQLTEGVITPLVPQLGWANPNSVFLGLKLTTQDVDNPHRDHSTIRLELADGTTVQPESGTRSTDGPFGKTAWFQLPADATEATALIDLELALGTDQYDVGELEIPLTISGSAAENADTEDAEDTEDDDAAEV